MDTLRVNDVLKDRILISRESARLLEGAIASIFATTADSTGHLERVQVTVDFDSVEGIAPSFLDELLLIFDKFVDKPADGPKRSLIVANPPTRLSSKFEAVARGHRMTASARPDGSWLLTDATGTDP
jgi:hypothetical protein